MFFTSYFCDTWFGFLYAIHLASSSKWIWHCDQDSNNTVYTYEDRTTRFFPPPPRIPQISGLGSGDSGLMDDLEDSFQELTTSSHQHFNILCSGDKDGFICFSIFGIFPIGNIVSDKLNYCHSIISYMRLICLLQKYMNIWTKKFYKWLTLFYYSYIYIYIFIIGWNFYWHV